MLQIEATEQITEEGAILAEPGTRGEVLDAERQGDGVIAVTVRFADGVTTAYLGEDCELVPRPELHVVR